MKLLFTGASGFLGKNILPILQTQFADVTTLGHLETDDLTVNLAKTSPSLQEHYDVVLHAAGKAHVVPKAQEEIQSFYDINFTGTKNLCAALEKVGVPHSLIFISTVAVYGCEEGELITEDHPLEGTTPYAKSKIMAEEFLQEWCAKNNVILTILRPSLLAGVDAPGNLGAMVNGLKKGFYLNIVGGKVQKSILMAEDIANLLPLIAEKGGIYNVCDSYQPTFGEIALSISKQLRVSKPKSIPYWLAWCVAQIGNCLGSKAPINSEKLKKITHSLTFSNNKIRKTLNWEPMDVLKNYHI